MKLQLDVNILKSAISLWIQDDNKQFAIDQGYNNISHQTDIFIWHNPL